MHLGRTTLSKFLIQQLNGIEGASDLGALLIDVAAAVKAISAMTAKGALGGFLGAHGGTSNVQGETQQKLDVLAERHHDQQLRVGRAASPAWSRRRLDEPYPIPARIRRAALSAGVRPAGRLLEHRCERLGRHDLLGAARTDKR